VTGAVTLIADVPRIKLHDILAILAWMFVLQMTVFLLGVY